jgi:methionyl aminopeptidase
MCPPPLQESCNSLCPRTLPTPELAWCCLQAVHSVADRHKLRVCDDFIGHGVGWDFHAVPQVFPVRNGERSLMKPNMTFTVEPIFVDGKPSNMMWKDGWTVVTRDGSYSAQHEHTILITEHGHEILTAL